MTSIGTIIKEIIIPHRKGKSRLKPEFVVLEDAHIQGFLLGTDYQRMYGIDIYNSKNRHITIELLALQHKVSGLRLAIDQDKLAAILQKPVPKIIKEMQSFFGAASYYRKNIKKNSHITSILYKLCSKYVVSEITKERGDSYERIKYELTNAPVLILPDFKLLLKLYIDSSCSKGLGEALHQRQIVDGEPREGKKIHYYLEGAVFEVYTDCTALKSLLNMKTTNRHMLRWQIVIQEYRGNMTIIYKEGKIRTNADGLSRWLL
ncbi:hypothetical protein O181_004312 [Austropuccinia psidii MF-1]|uniref:Reverse transcriptase RNase H-like domain-containing protein n=1 Tax=Austropuccinia psidii MF-1 TaxID=1389203 RepID=A0A9Q3BGJ1_9BASI|nr:hypothetical protein [Austropuccinia psidii MF-1]